MPSRISNQAALYLRSSKDRSDVSIDAQRRELTALATQRGLAGRPANIPTLSSPALTRIARDCGAWSLIYAGGRGWDTVLLLDTSRLARSRSSL